MSTFPGPDHNGQTGGKTDKYSYMSAADHTGCKFRAEHFAGW